MLAWLLKFVPSPNCKVCDHKSTVDGKLCTACWIEASKTDPSMGEMCQRCLERFPASGLKHNSICWGCWND